jgi:hypothetical protein
MRSLLVLPLLLLVGHARAAIDPPKLVVVEGRSGVFDEFVHVVGEVKNETATPLQFVKVTIDLLDASGKPLDVVGWHKIAAREAHVPDDERAYVDVPYLPAGASAPFHYIRDVRKIRGTYARHRLRASGVPAPANGPIARVEDVTMTLGAFDTVQVEGKVRVVSSVPCAKASAFVGFFDAKGTMIEEGTVFEVPGDNAGLPATIGPGETARLSGHHSFALAGAATSVRAWASCAFP